jgi:hypothetical protein
MGLNSFNLILFFRRPENIRSFTCAHYNEENVERVIMFVCGCCVNSMTSKNVGQGAKAKAGPALQRDEVDAAKPATKKPKLHLVSKTVAQESKVTVDPKKSDLAAPAPVLNKNVRPATPRPNGIEEPKKSPAAAAAENVKPKDLPQVPPKYEHKKPSEPRPETPELAKMYKPLPDNECTGMTKKEVRQAVDILYAKIEHNRMVKKWDNSHTSELNNTLGEQNKRQGIRKERGERC